MTCGHCGEAMMQDEIWGSLNGKPAHKECLFRLTAGSAAHILKECECYGGTRGDPPGMSLREAALLAYDAWRMVNAE